MPPRLKSTNTVKSAAAAPSASIQPSVLEKRDDEDGAQVVHVASAVRKMMRFFGMRHASRTRMPTAKAMSVPWYAPSRRGACPR